MAKAVKRNKKGDPWYRSGDDSWYITLPKQKPIPLRDEAGNKIKGEGSKGAAWLAFNRLASQQPANGEVSIGEVMDRYLSYCQTECSEDYYSATKTRLSDFLRFVGDTRLASVVPRHELRNWIETKKGWGNNVRNCAIQAVVTAYNFAIERGWVRQNQFSKMKRPPQVSRVIFFDEKQEAAIYEASQFSPAFQDFFSFLMATGCRPSEAQKIEASNCRETPQGIMVELADHKTAKKTGRGKIIVCNSEATAILRKLILRKPQGKLFASKRGNDYGAKKQAARATWRHVRAAVQKKYGAAFLPDKFVLYCCRHTFATRLLARGYSIPTVAALLGNSPVVCARVYGHLEQCHNVLFNAVNGASCGIAKAG